MIYTNLTKRALKLAFDAHKDQTDKSGMPYVFHPFHLAESMTDELSTVCALLHDVIEDTDITFDDLLSHGFPIEVIEILKLLTHCPTSCSNPASTILACWWWQATPLQTVW